MSLSVLEDLQLVSIGSAEQSVVGELTYPSPRDEHFDR